MVRGRPSLLRAHRFFAAFRDHSILVERLSSASASGNVVQNHTGPGLWVSSHISVLTLDGNTIESNGVDVECGARGLLIVNATQASSTQSTAIDPGCTVEGAPIF